MAGLIEFRSVGYRVGGRQILSGVDLRVEPGETLVLLGRSGSGKTTLLRMVNRLIEPSEGEVWFDGEPVRRLDVIGLRRKIGYVIQDGGLFPHQTVERNVALVLRLENWPETKISERVSALLDMVGLPLAQYGARYPRQLSGGEKQRVGIARALAADPPLLLLDEPFAALDPVTRFELQRQFVGLRQKLRQAALFVTHDLREALLVGSRIALLKDGRLEIVAEPAGFLRANTPEVNAFRAAFEHEWRLHESRIVD
jgi:osmoprotectant transport system ATP-binding protein